MTSALSGSMRQVSVRGSSSSSSGRISVSCSCSCSCSSLSSPLLLHSSTRTRLGPSRLGSLSPPTTAHPAHVSTRSYSGLPLPISRAARAVVAASPWDEVDLQFDRQFAQMERQMDRDIADIFGRTSTALAQQRQEVQRVQEAVRQQVQAVQPDVQIQRLEQRSSGRYSYYQSVQISTGGYHFSSPPAAVAAAPLNPLILVAALLAAAHVAVATTFVKNYDLTTYSPRWRWTLTLLWPLLAVFNKSFRHQLLCVLQGKRAPSSERQEPGPEAS